LPPAQRKIVLQLAFLWEGVGAKEIADATKMDSKLISAQLKQLIEKGIADRIQTKNKNNLYRLSERFFNLWLIFTQGSPREKRKAKYLTVFLENFYDAQEISRMAAEHLQTLKEGKANANKAALMTKALAQSRHISTHMRDELIVSTLALRDMAEELRHQLPYTFGQIRHEIDAALAKKDYDTAMRIARSIEHDDGYREFQLGFIQFSASNFHEAEKYFQAANRHNIPLSGSLLATTYYVLNKRNKNVAELIRSDMELVKETSGDFLHFIEFIFDIWHGKLKNLEERAINLFQQSRWDVQDYFFIWVLAHGQANLVMKLFSNEHFGMQLKEKFLPMYYAANILANNGEQDNNYLKIPPELQETVDQLLARIDEWAQSHQ
jgi:DNA-binding transcriptional regulator GbsR (MarR family)